MSRFDSYLFRQVPDPHYFAMKRIIITGASGGIGRACCTWLLNQGSRIAMIGREIKDLEIIGRDFPAQVICIQCDLTKESEHKDAIICALENLGGLDILINAAGVMYENDLESTSPREHDYLMSINLRAVFSLSKLCHSSLLRSQGTIINLSSEWGHRPQQGMISYCMSKAGLEMLTKSLAIEMAPIRVNAVAPGMVNTKFLNFNMRTEEVPQIKATYRSKNPLHKIARVDEIVRAIVFLASKKAAKITGQILVVDGGDQLTSSLFTHWLGAGKMNAKFLPNGADTFKQISAWFEKNIERFKKPTKNEIWVKGVAGKSNWFTNLADAHYKIGDFYNKIDGEDHVLGALVQLKDDDGHIYTAEHPKPARYMEDGDNTKTTLRPTLTSRSIDFFK
ncbi:hypothetical protein SteCoe_35019 [Stentor coeruleus]|uniref:Uncharacterized protein n=1 Tax=Stentor coeruleus TaxID=5963 RepID=A0A1R2ATL1_9CILI|nr:hypothetical protein SteCoe_35019 [Stentor coeruleus]